MLTLFREQSTKKQTQFHYLDIQTLQMLEDLSDPGEDSLVIELKTLFEESTPPLLAELEAAAEAVQVEKIARIAHRIKGSALNIGAQNLATLCSNLEKTAATNSVQENIRLIREINLTYINSHNEISSWLARNLN